MSKRNPAPSTNNNPEPVNPAYVKGSAEYFERIVNEINGIVKGTMDPADFLNIAVEIWEDGKDDFTTADMIKFKLGQLGISSTLATVKRGKDQPKPSIKIDKAQAEVKEAAGKSTEDGKRLIKQTIDGKFSYTLVQSLQRQ